MNAPSLPTKLLLVLGLVIAAAGCAEERPDEWVDRTGIGPLGGGGVIGIDGDQGDTVGTTVTGSGIGTLPCANDAFDVWSVHADFGDFLEVEVDTIGSSSTFDPAMQVFDSTDVDSGAVLNSADDSFECSYPPPQYQCPYVGLITPTTGTYGIKVFRASGCPDGTGTASYEVRVLLNSDEAAFSLYDDDAS